jgi:single-stranded DNA-specific DHH superfamily exonuclease
MENQQGDGKIMSHITNQQVLKKVDNFLRKITKKDRVGIIHDTDPDGVCSAVIMAKCIERLRGKKIDLRIPVDKKQYGITKEMLKKIKKEKITKLITTDFSAEHNIPTLKEIEKQAEILVVDHHKLYADYKSNKTILYKPQYFTKIEPSAYCTAKLAYDAASRVSSVSDLDWVAATACIADIATAPWKKWLAGVFKKYKVKMKSQKAGLFENSKTKFSSKDLFQTQIGQAAATISSTEVYNANLVPQCYEVFYKAKKPKDILTSKLGKYKKIIDKELKKHLILFEKKAERHGETRVYELTSPYRVHSPLSTILGLKHPHKTIIIINKSTTPVSVSARRHDKKVAVNNLLEKAIKGFKGANAGGHVPAAGAGFDKKYLSKFKKRLIAWKT